MVLKQSQGIQSDVVIVGGGIAGLSTAIYLATTHTDINIRILFKAQSEESNTNYAQGGIVGVFPSKGDSVSDHIEDTMVAGDHTNDKRIVELVSKESSAAIEDLVSWGVSFDKDTHGQFHTVLEGGHSFKRIFHHKDHTGTQIQHALLYSASQFPNIFFDEFAFLYDFTEETQNGIRLQILNTQKQTLETCYTRDLVLATGGIGQMYSHTTNPDLTTGDGIALAIRKGIRTSNLPYVQFHPTALDSKETEKAFLISEAVRGHGGELYNHKGERFMHRYDSRLELAPRDIVARAIYNEMHLQDTTHMLLDVSQIEDFTEHFPTISAHLKAIGLDLQDGIPVCPAAHYVCGGIDTDDVGKTSMNHVYALGETAHTGLHGSNRLASNSLLEGVVFAKRVAADILAHFSKPVQVSPTEYKPVHYSQGSEKDRAFRHNMQTVVETYLGVQKSTHGIQTAIHSLESLLSELELDQNELEGYSLMNLENYNLLHVSLELAKQALKIQTNSGVFFNTDL